MHTAPAELPTSLPPADAQHVAEWVDETGDGQTWGRYVRGSRRTVAGVEVVVACWQGADGRVELHASLRATDVQFDAASLREFATVHLDTADELNRHAVISQCTARDLDDWPKGADEDGDPIMCHHERDKLAQREEGLGARMAACHCDSALAGRLPIAERPQSIDGEMTYKPGFTPHE